MHINIVISECWFVLTSKAVCLLNFAVAVSRSLNLQLLSQADIDVPVRKVMFLAKTPGLTRYF